MKEPGDFRHHLFMARRRTGMSQRALAEVAGLSLDSISKLERGKRSPNLTAICLLARALEVKPSELIDGLRPPRPLP
jgi:transcriptional regulator with XRE-family HTH domain